MVLRLGRQQQSAKKVFFFAAPLPLLLCMLRYSYFPLRLLKALTQQLNFPFLHPT